MIRVRDLTKKFGPIVAVSDLNFEIKKGEIIGFIGPNGAGKTTTMRLIVGYLTPTEGEVLVNGVNPIIERMKVSREIGYLPENNPLYTDMLVREYLEFISRIKNDDSWAEKVSSVGLETVINKKIEELSRGFKQRVGLAAALIGNPSILILDEPTSGLDPIEQEKIRDLIKKVSKRRIVIFSTHILSEAEAIATRIMIINHGKLGYDGKKPKTLSSLNKLFKKVVKK